jgi:hypothetical protein
MWGTYIPSSTLYGTSTHLEKGFGGEVQVWEYEICRIVASLSVEKRADIQSGLGEDAENYTLRLFYYYDIS